VRLHVDPLSILAGILIGVGTAATIGLGRALWRWRKDRKVHWLPSGVPALSPIDRLRLRYTRTLLKLPWLSDQSTARRRATIDRMTARRQLPRSGTIETGFPEQF
jgi:hypothetical protein